MEHEKGREATEPNTGNGTQEHGTGKRDRRSGIARIAGERAKQLIRWSAEHDDNHNAGELVEAAQQLLTAVQDGLERTPAGVADWGLVERHPDPIERLTIAGALIAAEIDRRLRTARRREIADEFPLSEDGLRAELARLGGELEREVNGARRRELTRRIEELTEELQRVTGERDPADTSEADAAGSVTVCQGCGEAEAVRRTTDDVPLCGDCFGEAADSARDRQLHVDLWDRINAYAEACGGDTGGPCSGRRMDAVVALERAVEALVEARRGHWTGVVLGNAVGLRLYRVDDGDGEMFVVARDFTDAIARWRKQLHVENPGDETRLDWEPDSVVHLCGGGDLLLPRVAEREVSNG